ncbi:MAG TPA: VWA domain-containing protein [Chloroflexota bacterium]
MTFGIPALLALLVVLPLAVLVYALAQRRRPRYTARFTNLNLLANVMPRRPAWRRYLPPALYLLSLGALLTALAKPYATVKLPKQEGAVMLVMDVSGSMDAHDVQPTRLAAAVTEAEHFVDRLPGRFQVGVVAFSSVAQVLAAPTTDRVQVRNALESMRANGGTAMGDGIERGLDFSRQTEQPAAAGATRHDRLKSPPPASSPAPTSAASGAPRTGSAPSSAVSTAGRAGSGASVLTSGRPMAMVLLSDGANNAGQVTPEVAAEDASQLHVPIYTIALGTPGGTLDVRVSNRGVRRIAVPPDPATLQRVAQISGGRSFAAPSDQDLRSIYDSLATRIGFDTQPQEVTPLFIGAAAVLLLVGGVLATVWFHRFP